MNLPRKPRTAEEARIARKTLCAANPRELRSAVAQALKQEFPHWSEKRLRAEMAIYDAANL